MAKKNNGAIKMLEGAIAGLALGVAASMFMASKKGKALKNSIADVSADFYKYISPKIKKAQKMGEKEYKEFMKSSVAQYAKAKKISEKMAKDLVKEAQSTWKHISKHL